MKRRLLVGSVEKEKATAKKNKRKTTEKEANGAVSLCG
jgi:hypothetical protein